MSDWKVKYNVSDEGARKAGIYGEPSCMSDILRAQEESEKIRNPPAPVPTNAGERRRSRAGRPLDLDLSDNSFSLSNMKVIGFIIFIGLIIFVISTADYWEREIKNTLLNAEASTVKSLDVAHYENLSPEATKMSAQSTSQLYASTFPKQSVGAVIGLTDKQEFAVAAAWLRYARDPTSFDKLPEKNRRFIIYTFDIYLTSLIDGGDANAKRDFMELYNRELNRR